MPSTCARHLRLALEASVARRRLRHRRARGPAVRVLALASRRFFRSVAAEAPRGAYPRWLAGEQSYWTPVGVPDGDTCALMNEEGLVEVDRGTFSLEPFLFAGDRLLTWADADGHASSSRTASADPVLGAGAPTGLVLRTTAFAHACATGRPVLFVRYRRRERPATRRDALRLFAALRPFQVNPPWQAFGELGGVSPIHELAGDGDGRAGRRHAHRAAARRRRRRSAPPPSTRANVVEHLRARRRAAARDGAATPSASPRARCASTSTLAPGARARRLPRGPVRRRSPTAAATAPRRRRRRRRRRSPPPSRAWARQLGGVAIDARRRAGSATPTRCARRSRTCWSSATARRCSPDRAATRARGSATARSWRRRCCASAASTRPATFVRWYAGFQAADGNVPCSVDRSGPDWLVEHDSHGAARSSRSPSASASPATARSSTRSGRRSRAPPATSSACARRASAPSTRRRRSARCRGLLPESASHEGYLAHPVHSYWDDFWAVRGLGDAACLAAVRGDAGRGGAARARCATRSAPSVRDLARAHDRDPRHRLRAGLGRVGRLRPDRDLERDLRCSARRRSCRPPSSPRTFAEYLAGFRRRRAERDRLDQLHRLRGPHRRRAGAARRARERRTSSPTSCSTTAGRRPGTSGPRSPGATRGAPATSATCRTPGSPPSTCSRSAPCSPTSAWPTRRWWSPPACRPPGSTTATRSSSTASPPTAGTLGFTLRRTGPDDARRSRCAATSRARRAASCCGRRSAGALVAVEVDGVPRRPTSPPTRSWSAAVRPRSSMRYRDPP